MISASDRENAVMLIEEAADSGATYNKACELLGITERTYYRWKNRKNTTDSYEDGRPGAVRPEPANKLTSEERLQIIEICNSPEYASKPPCEIVPALADEGIYIASESTIYRILREEKMQNHRGRAEAPKHNRPTSYSATAPNQVYMWDITYLNGPHKGMFYYLYLFSDLFDRNIVGWEVYEEESAELASELIRRITLKQGRLTTDPLVLHSDNGSPMKGATMLATLYQLGITPSNSRPRVSNDNPYSESLFKTLKYRPNYQPKGFATLEEARNWVSLFVKWYNHDHHHSGLKFLTPSQRRSGAGDKILANRHDVYEAAKAAHPERWNGRSTRDWSLPDTVYLNPANNLEVTQSMDMGSEASAS
jgi:putative transposase